MNRRSVFSYPAAQVQQSPLQAQQQKLIDLQSAPIKKESLWKDVLTKVVLGANAALNPNPNNKIVGWGRMKRDAEIAREQGVLGTMQQAQDYNANQAIRNNQIEAGQITNEYNKTVKPAIAQSNILDKEADNKLNAEKFDFDREYKTIRNQLGERRANDWKEIKNTELELKARGLDQTDERIKLIEQALKDTKAGKELDNKTRVEIEKMRQEGANTRTNTTVAGSLKRQELTEASKKALQEIAGKEGKAKTAQTAVDRWMGNQVKQGINPTQDQIEEYRQYVLKSLQ